MRNPYTASCCWPGCESAARPNEADMENGPKPSDLDPVYCPYHNAEATLIYWIGLDLWAERELKAKEDLVDELQGLVSEYVQDSFHEGTDMTLEDFILWAAYMKGVRT